MKVIEEKTGRIYSSARFNKRHQRSRYNSGAQQSLLYPDSKKKRKNLLIYGKYFLDQFRNGDKKETVDAVL